MNQTIKNRIEQIKYLLRNRKKGNIKKYKKFTFMFWSFTLLILLVNIIMIIIFTKAKVVNNFYNALSVASLGISFASFAASCFFSLSVYLQSMAQTKISESLPKKDDQYIINNYSLFDLQKEFTTFSLQNNEKEEVLKNKNYLTNEKTYSINEISRFVFLPTNSVNAPTYKVLLNNIKLIDKANLPIFNANNMGRSIDGNYAPNILQRNYNCICVDIKIPLKDINNYLSYTKYLEISLDIISIFNVKFAMKYIISIDCKKDTSKNIDKNAIPDLESYIIHHTNSVILAKEICNNNESLVTNDNE